MEYKNEGQLMLMMRPGRGRGLVLNIKFHDEVHNLIFVFTFKNLRMRNKSVVNFN